MFGLPPTSIERELQERLLLEHAAANSYASCLDVGGCSTFRSYAPAIAQLIPTYDTVDVDLCPRTAEIVRSFWIGNVTELEGGTYELVFSISAIEHAGISYQVGDFRQERYEVMKAMVRLATGTVFCTAPFGRPILIEGQYANITDADLCRFDELAPFEYRFFRTAGHDHPLVEVARDEAVRVEFDPSIGIPLCHVVMQADV